MSKSFKILLKRAETSIVSIVFKGVLSALCCYVSLLYMNQVLGELYMSSSCKDKVDMCPFIATVNVNK